VPYCESFGFELGTGDCSSHRFLVKLATLLIINIRRVKFWNGLISGYGKEICEIEKRVLNLIKDVEKIKEKVL
jgi:hypothetical protein